MQSQDRNYYTHAKYGVVFFVSLALLIIIVIMSFVSVFSSDDTDYYAETERAVAAEELPETGGLWRLCGELKSAGTVSGGALLEEYPALYGMLTGTDGEVYTETGGGYICMAKAYTKRLSRYVNTEVMLVPCASAAEDGRASVTLGDASYMTLRYSKKEDTLTYLITSAADSKITYDSIRVEFDVPADAATEISYRINTVRGVSDTEQRDNKFQQFVNLYSGSASRIIKQSPAEYGEDSLGGFADSGFSGDCTGVIFNMQDDLSEVYCGAEAAVCFEGDIPAYRVVID